MHSKPKTTPRIPPDEYSKILKRLSDGEFQHRIAAEYGVNQGRISEIKTGKATGWHAEAR